MPAASYRIFAARQRLDALFVHAFEALSRQPGSRRLRELSLYTLERSARCIPLLEFVVAVPHLEQGIRHLSRPRELRHDYSELGERHVEHLRHIVRLSQPVLCIIGQLAIRIRHQELLECHGRGLVALLLEQLERSLVVVAIRTTRQGQLAWRQGAPFHYAGRGTGLEFLDAGIKIRIKLSLPVRRGLRAVLEFLDTALDLIISTFHRAYLLRQVDQALVLNYPLDRLHAALELVQFDQNRVFARRLHQLTATERERSSQKQ